MLRSSSPTPFPKAFAANAGIGYIRPIPSASQTGVTPGAASLTDGFPPLCFISPAAGGIPPFGQDMNGILYEATLALQWLQAGGLPVDNSTFSTAIGGYPNGAVLIKADGSGMWISGVDNNTSDPDTGGANWSSFGNGSNAGDGRYPLFAGAAGGTANALTATINPCGISAPYAGMVVFVEAGVANSNTTPTLNLTLGSTAAGAHVIQKLDGQALAIGDIAGAGHFLCLEWNSGSSNWMLLNPASVNAVGSGQSWSALAVPSVRTSGVVYTNSTGKAIEVNIVVGCDATEAANLLVAGNPICRAYSNCGTSITVEQTLSAIVPDGATYELTLTGAVSIYYWNELA